MSYGNETLQKRGGSNEPNRSLDIGIVPNIRGRGKTVALNQKGPDIELIPPPAPDNKGRCIGVYSTWPYGSLGLLVGEVEGEIYLVDANNVEHPIASVLCSGGTEEVGINNGAPGIFPCLLHDEKVIFRPGGVVDDRKGLFLSAYHDTDAIALRVPLIGTAEVEIVKAPPGKIVGFPSIKDPEDGVGPIAIAGALGTPAVFVSLYLEDSQGNKFEITDDIELDGTTFSGYFLDGVLTLAPGDRLLAKAQNNPGPNVTIFTTIALLNAANEP
jgi:hypothetical protein